MGPLTAKHDGGIVTMKRRRTRESILRQLRILQDIVSTKIRLVR
jgi:hypothetical protein